MAPGEADALGAGFENLTPRSGLHVRDITKPPNSTGFTTTQEQTSQRAHDVKKTSYQRRCDVMMSHRRRSDVILTSCACWDGVVQAKSRLGQLGWLNQRLISFLLQTVRYVSNLRHKMFTCKHQFTRQVTWWPPKRADFAVRISGFINTSAV